MARNFGKNSMIDVDVPSEETSRECVREPGPEDACSPDTI